MQHTACLLLRTTLLLALLAALLAPGAAAQPVSFGSSDDPREPSPRAPWQAEQYVGLWAGPSLIGPRWRAAATLEAFAAGPSYAFRLEGPLRAGTNGLYDPDTDEWYDLARVLRFARYERARPGLALYARAGPIQKMRLGPGHLADFFRSDLAYDERTVGVEAYAGTPVLSLGAFTDDVRLDGVTGGRLAARPFAGTGRPALASAEVGLTAVTDLGLTGGSLLVDSLDAPTAFALDARYDALDRGGIVLSPFASAAAYRHYGWGLGAGAALESENFIDLARFQLRLAAFYNAGEFVPGYFGAFYTASNPRARLADADDFFEDAPGRQGLVDTPLREVENSAGWELGLRLLFFERFELHSAYYGHFGSQDLSRYHLRLFFGAPQTARLYVRLDRAGLTNVFSIFGAADDQTALTFNIDYRAVGNLWAHLRTRYTFERLADAPDGTQRYLAERRFEPSVGLRLDL